MKYNICSISFRHELVSFHDLLQFAGLNAFSGIELWGVHGLSILRYRPKEIPLLMEEMTELGIEVSMVSDYLDLNADTDQFKRIEAKWHELIRLASAFRTNKIRVFAGNRGSAESKPSEWELVIGRLRRMADYSSEYGIHALIETHPHTYADCLESTLRLLDETVHPYIGINLDFLHLWETGASPLAAWSSLKPAVRYFHLKNVLDSKELHVFAPENVYSPNGSRRGIASLAEGKVDYRDIITRLNAEDRNYQASIEWFGNEPFRYLQSERLWLEELEASRLLPKA